MPAVPKEPKTIMRGFTAVSRKAGNERTAADLAIVVGNLGPGGAQRVLTTLANEWAKRGKRICIFLVGDTGDRFFPLDERVGRIVLSSSKIAKSHLHGFLANMNRVAALRRALKNSGAPTAISFIGQTNVLMLVAAAGLGLKTVVSERNDLARQALSPPWAMLRRVLYRSANTVTANSPRALADMKSYVPEAKLAYLPNPLVIPASTDADREKSNPVILSVGSLTAQKGYDILIPAFARIGADAAGWRLGIVGAGPQETPLKELAEKQGIGGVVDWHGRQNDPFKFYRAASMFAMASRYEGTPNALLEAMAHGLPPVVSDSLPGALEFVEHETTGLVFRENDPEALADAMRRLVSDAGLRSRLGAAARLRVQPFALDNVMPVWDRVLGLNGS